MRCTSMDAEEIDMVYVDMGGHSHQHSDFALSMWQMCAKLFSSAFALLCLVQGVVCAGYQTKVLSHSTKPIVAVRFTPSGGVIAVSEDGAMTLWNGDTGRPIWNISLARAPRKNDYTQIKISAMDLSPDGRMAVVTYLRSGVDRNLIDENAADPTKQKDGVWETHVVLIDATDGAIKKDIEDVRDTSVRAVLFASSAKYVFVTTSTSMARAVMKHQPPTSTTYVLSSDTGQVVRSFRSQGWIASATLSPDDKRFAAAAQQYMEGGTNFFELQFYDADTGQLLHNSKFETTRSAAISFSFDGSLLAISRSGRDGIYIELVPKDVAGKVTHYVPAPRSTECRAIAFISELHRIVLAGGTLHLAGFDDIGTARFKDQGGIVFVVDQRSGEKLRTCAFASFVTCLAVSRDGLKMAAGMYDGRIAITAVV
ncbi:MAG TPA: WD40 repeat domain-containing protein [Blastocatellia bacterium]|nr:WD40 repeat domain-containing protein [Blastocatellia bacterium]